MHANVSSIKLILGRMMKNDADFHASETERRNSFSCLVFIFHYFPVQLSQVNIEKQKTSIQTSLYRSGIGKVPSAWKYIYI